MTDEERRIAWDIAYDCLHYGDPEAIVIQVDQRKLIELVHKLLNHQPIS